MNFPSGEYTGFPSNPGCVVIRLVSPPETGTTNKSAFVLIASILSVTAVKQISFPSGDHLTISAPVESFVSACASPPSIESRYTCESPFREERNASVSPSGDHTGEESCPLCVNCIAAPPAVETTQMLLTPRFVSMSGVETVYATHLPSRDTCGSAMRCNLIMSSKVMGCFADSCAEMVSPDPSSNALT